MLNLYVDRLVRSSYSAYGSRVPGRRISVHSGSPIHHLNLKAQGLTRLRDNGGDAKHRRIAEFASSVQHHYERITDCSATDGPEPHLATPTVSHRYTYMSPYWDPKSTQHSRHVPQPQPAQFYSYEAKPGRR